MKWRRRLKKLLLTTMVVSALGAAVGAWMYREHVVLAPGEHLSEENIQSLIAQESTVLFADGETAIGVFFTDEHRRYVPYEEIPQAWVQAITSAEDQRYFQHFGVDLRGLTRAMIQNVKAGKLVSGGSTLTMQTSENLFHPGARSLPAKLSEVVDTLRLEAHYSKEDILEFYANQFHVYGNGRGLGIAARYFFDKEVTELDVQESAFIAGMVKIPARYNPFIGSTEEKRATARRKAQTRVTYVLGRMWADGHIDEATYKELSERPLPFKKGTFRYDRSVVMDEVEQRLEQAPFPELFAAQGIDNPSTAGIRIVTTLDEGAQRSAIYGLWHHLTVAGGSLEGVTLEDFFHADSLAPRPDPNNAPKRFEFRYASVQGADEAGVRLDLGGFECVLDDDAVDRVAGLLAVAEKGERWARPGKGLRASVVDSLTEGRVVWVSMREQVDGQWRCDPERRPELQGAVVVLDDGQLRAMVGGNDNRNFNRALRAQRQLGSTWKVLVYHAALQLGWAPTDALDNRRAVFPFSGTWYYPRPDHSSEDFTSIAWAGVRSENLATIWLLYHLVDRLNAEQVRRLAELTDLAQRPGEDRLDWIARVRDTYGVIATRSRVEDGLFGAVKEQVITDLAFTGHPEDALELRSLHYGRGFDKEAAKVRRDKRGAERAARLKALEANFLGMEALLPRCDEQLEVLKSSDSPPAAAAVNLLSVLEVDGRFKVSCDAELEGWTEAHLAPLWPAPELRTLPAMLEGEALEAPAPARPELLEDMLLRGRLHASTVRAVREAIEQRRPATELLDPYDAELLYQHPDFRMLLGMRYLAGLAGELGVQTELPPVLSMPLGAVDISLAEGASMYQGFLKGERWTFPGAGFTDGAVAGLRTRFEVPAPEGGGPLLIQEIRDRDGDVIYRVEPEPIQVADAVSGRLVLDILANVVEHGTGRRTRGLVPGVPLGGKTGTTNAFRNAAFLGYAPVVNDDQVEPTNAVTVAAYVGYDDNRPMQNNSIRLQGASGALPAWMGTVSGMHALQLLGSWEGALEAAETEGLVRVPVADLSGLPMAPEEGVEVSRSVLVQAPASSPSRRFAPYADRAVVTEAADEALPAPPDAPTDGEGDAEPSDTAMDDPGIGGAPSVWDDIINGSP